MSKYHKGDKFIVEIKEVMNSDNGTLYRSDFKTLTFDDNGLDKLQKCETELSWDECYNKGLNDVWELVRKLYCEGIPFIDVLKMFDLDNDRIDNHGLADILINFTPQEALAKLEAYEKKIEVGDVVRLKGSDKEYVVTTIDEDRCSEIYCGVSKDGRWFSQCNVEKTGKHIDIQSVLEQIGE